MQTIWRKHRNYIWVLPLCAVALFYQITFTVVTVRTVFRSRAIAGSPFLIENQNVVYGNKAAEQAGLHKGDRVLSIDGIALTNERQLHEDISRHHPGDVLTITEIPKGQTEAAGALGLRPGQTLRLVVVPQAMRVIIPPLTSQYLNLTKNSSLAVAIGYPDLVQVFMGTVLNQTGQAVEVVAITMAVYLTISLVTSAVMNAYNRRVAIVER